MMGIDGAPVSEEGEVTFRGHERVDFKYLLTKRKLGETVRISLLRGAHSKAGATEFNMSAQAESPSVPEPVELSMSLAPSHELLPRELDKDYVPHYVVIGGLVFIIAGLPLLVQLWNDESKKGGTWNLMHKVQELRSCRTATKDSDAGRGDRDTQAIICSDRLAHDVRTAATLTG